MLWCRIRRLARTVVTSFRLWPLLSIGSALWLSSTLASIARTAPVDQEAARGLIAASRVYASAILKEPSQVTQRIDRMLADLSQVVTDERLLALQQLRERITVVPPITPVQSHPSTIETSIALGPPA